MSLKTKILLNVGLVFSIIIIAALDVMSGGSPRLRVPYFIPIGVSAYLSGLLPSLVLSLLAAIADFLSSVLLGRQVTASLIIGILIRTGTFVIAALGIDRIATQLSIIRGLESRRDSELKRAKEVQSSVVVAVPPSIADIAIAGRITFARELGGDYYYVSTTNNGVFFAIGDISGKSVSAAMFSVLLHHSLLDTLAESLDPAEIMRSLNRRLFPVLPDDMFITLFLGLIDGPIITFVNAGHEQPFHYKARPNEVGVLGEGGTLPIGVDREIEVENRKEPFWPGDILLALTDGVTESPAFIDDPISRLTTFLKENRKERAGDIVDLLHRLAAPDPIKQRDDVTILCFIKEP